MTIPIFFDILENNVVEEIYMKITYLELKNFASIYAGMRKKHIMIPLHKQKHRVVVLVGETGSGKTSILRELHPYAYTNLDARSTSELILEDHDGYKEIHIESKKHKYVIVHYYKNNHGRSSVKSFIKKDDTELNPNGNVTSFKTHVTAELGLDTDFLKLLRLGPNVTTFVKMNPSNRKHFINDLLTELNVFSDLFKKFNAKFKEAKVLLKSVSEKMQKIGSYENKDKFEEDIQNAESEVKILEDDIVQLNKQIWELESKIKNEQKEFGPLVKEIGNLSTRLKIVEDALMKLTERRAQIIEDNIDVRDAKEYEDKLKTQLASASDKKSQFEKDVTRLLNEQTEISAEIESKGLLLEDSTGDIPSLRVALSEIEDKERLILKTFKEASYQHKLSSEEYKQILQTLMTLQDVVRNIYEFSPMVVQMVVDSALNGDLNGTDHEKEIHKIDQKILNEQNRESIAEKLNLSEKIYVVTEPEGHGDCPYKDLFMRASESNESEEETENVLSNLKAQRNLHATAFDVLKNVKYIQMVCDMHSQLDEKSGQNWFSLKRILGCIETGEMIYSEEDLSERIFLAQSYEEFEKLDSQKKTIVDEINRLEKTEKIVKSITRDIEKNKERLTTIKPQLSDAISNLEKYERECQDLEKKLIDITSLEDLESQIQELSVQQTSYMEALNKEKSYKENMERYTQELTLFSSQKHRKGVMLNDMNKKITDLRIAYHEYAKLSEEANLLEGVYNELSIIKDSLSPTGDSIPLVFIEAHMGRVMSLMNQLLEELKNEKLEFNTVLIDDDEFSIPYISNGIPVKDISYASQGEESQITMALSFALIATSIGINTDNTDDVFNIPSLDELDAALDINKRSTFILNMEKFLDIIQAEQAFVISHNNMFDSYPVDVIRTSNIDIDSFKNANLIYE